MTAKSGDAPLFPFGYGLTGREAATPWRALPEDPGVADAGTDGVYFAAGRATPGFSLEIGDGSGSGTRIATVPAQALGGRVKVTAVDYGVQEGARHFSLAGGGPQTIAVQATEPLDLGRQNNGDVMLVTTLRVDRPVGSDVTLGVACAGACRGTVAIPAAALPVGSWRSIAVPFKCFGKASEMTRVAAPFVLRTALPLEISVARIATGMNADTVLRCGG